MEVLTMKGRVNHKHNRELFGLMPFEDNCTVNDMSTLIKFWYHANIIYSIFHTTKENNNIVPDGLNFTQEEFNDITPTMLAIIRYCKYILDTRVNVYQLADSIKILMNKHTTNSHPISELFNNSASACFQFMIDLNTVIKHNGGYDLYPHYIRDINKLKSFTLQKTPDESGYISQGYDFYQVYGPDFDKAFLNLSFCIYHTLKLAEIGYDYGHNKILRQVLNGDYYIFIYNIQRLLEKNENKLYLGRYYEDYDYGLEDAYEFRKNHDIMQ